MQRHVAVIDKDGVVLAEYPITLGYINATAQDQEYFDEAHRQAIEDQLIEPNDAAAVSFRFIEREQPQ